MTVRSRARRAAVLGAALASVAAACTDVGTDPQSVVSFVADTTLVPSLFFGDTLRDTVGNAFSLGRIGRAFNSRGETIADAPFTVFVTPADTVPANGGGRAAAAGVVAGSGNAQFLVANAAAPTAPVVTPAVSVTVQFAPGLRVTRRFEIVPRPVLARVDATTATSVRLDTSGTSGTAVIAVRVFADAGATQPVRSHLVRFVLPDSTFAQAFVSGVTFAEPGAVNARRDVRFDTTDATGIASRSLTIAQTRGAPSTATVNVTVQAHVLVGRPLRDTTLLVTVPVRRAVGTP